MPYKNKEDKNAWSRRKYNEHKEKKICPKCWKKLPEMYGYMFCPQCSLKRDLRTQLNYKKNAEREKKRQKELRDKRRAMHLCTHCGTELQPDWGTIKCTSCSRY